jgi:predicted RNA-binding protein
MAYYLDIFSPETYENFLKSSQDITGFRIRQSHAAKKINPGDKLICYMTKLSRWIGVLEVLSESFVDDTPRFFDKNDPFVVRFKVKPVVWLPKEHTIPIREDHVWNNLSITKDHDKHGSGWTGLFRGSLNHLDDEDGKFLEGILVAQLDKKKEYPVDEAEYRKWLTQRVKGPEGDVTVSVPEDTGNEKPDIKDETSIRDSMKVQALVAQIGEKMGFKIWIPRNDRSRVLQEWKPEAGILIEELPLSYDQATLKTIEQIDVLWLRRRSIVRAFEVEHTTSIYSGILRMADLLALQPNMDIKLHLVAPGNRREKVFEELQRPVFSLLERGPLADACTFISYDSLYELAKQKHLSRMSDSVLEDYAETVE